MTTTEQFILTLFSVGILYKYAKKKTNETNPKVTGMRYSYAGAETFFYSSKKKAMEAFLYSKKPASLNDEIYNDGSGYITASANLQSTTGLPAILSTKQQISDAITAIKEMENGLALLIFTSENYAIPSRKNILNDIYDNYIERIDRKGILNETDAYIYTLYYLAKGGKFRWSSSATSRGVKNELIATSGNARTDRKGKAKILNERTGITPERLAEQIGGEKDYEARNGILEAISATDTPTQAFELLANAISAAGEPFKHPGGDAPF